MIKGTYKLISVIDTMQQINVAKKVNGKTTFGVLRLYPGVTYELEDDETLLNSLKGAKVEKRYSPLLVEILKENNIAYEEVLCHSCGGRVKKIRYNIIEVMQ